MTGLVCGLSFLRFKSRRGRDQLAMPGTSAHAARPARASATAFGTSVSALFADFAASAQTSDAREISRAPSAPVLGHTLQAVRPRAPSVSSSICAQPPAFDPSKHADALTRKSSNARMPSLQLPEEIWLHGILPYLSEPDLHRASQASRALRRMAHACAQRPARLTAWKKWTRSQIGHENVNAMMGAAIVDVDMFGNDHTAANARAEAWRADARAFLNAFIPRDLSEDALLHRATKLVPSAIHRGLQQRLAIDHGGYPSLSSTDLHFVTHIVGPALHERSERYRKLMPLVATFEVAREELLGDDSYASTHASLVRTHQTLNNLNAATSEWDLAYNPQSMKRSKASVVFTTALAAEHLHDLGTPFDFDPESLVRSMSALWFPVMHYRPASINEWDAESPDAADLAEAPTPEAAEAQSNLAKAHILFQYPPANPQLRAFSSAEVATWAVDFLSTAETRQLAALAQHTWGRAIAQARAECDLRIDALKHSSKV